MRVKNFLGLVGLMALMLDAVVALFYAAAMWLSYEAYTKLPYGISPFLLIGAILMLLLWASIKPPRKESEHVGYVPQHYRANRF